jgi:asparagine synthase (glutamine-hydrolysing)
MCGIAGIFAYDNAAPAADRDELRRVRDHMAARGPDGIGEWFSNDGRVALGHRRLAIIDLSERGAQPMVSADGKFAVVCNGEIYNYRELRKSLEAKGRVFTSHSDTEVLLHLYAEKGAAMLHDLRGMYAIALWDSEKRCLLLARDPFGIKPLYYADHQGTFRFASQVKALLLAPADTTPEPAGHAGFYLWGSVPEPYTLYRGIRALPAGHSLVVSDNDVGEPVAFCRISDILIHAARTSANGSRETALNAISAAIQASVLAHQVADVPVGVFLSAGIDSCLIAATAATHGANSFTLTLGFKEFAGTLDDEVPLAEEVARLLGAWHSTLMTDRQDFELEREKLLAAMDQPTIDGVNTWFVARAARQMDLKVALSGLGGDELFASYPSFRQVPALVRCGKPLSALPGFGRVVRKLSAPMLSHLTSPKYAGLLEYSRDFGSAYLLRRCLYAPWELPSVLDPDMARAGWQDLQSLNRLNENVLGISSDRLAVSALEMNWYMRNQLLRDADWAGMAQSMEIRVPFLDVDLLRETAPWFAAYPEITKAELAAVAAPHLPPALLVRPKTGFSVPVREWIKPVDGSKHERGLRGWAQFVHGRFSGATR